MSIDVYDTFATELIEQILNESDQLVLLESGEWCLINRAALVEDDGWYPSDECQSCSSCGHVVHNDDDDMIILEYDSVCGTECAEREGYYLHDDGEWRSHPQPSHDLMSYSSTNLRIDGADAKNPFQIGFEVEKEDEEHLDREINSRAQNRGWIAVEDGSLDDEYGFELVSPCYNLKNIAEIRDTISNYHDIDADCNNSCGGHITVSEYGLSGEMFTAKHRQLNALMYALYNRRLKNNYTIGTKAKDGRRTMVGEENGLYDVEPKYRAINVKQCCVEYRLISRVRSRKQLIWRLELISYCLHHPEDIKTELADPNSWLYKHLQEHYSEEKMEEKLELFYDFYRWEIGFPVTKKIQQFLPLPYGLG